MLVTERDADPVEHFRSCCETGRWVNWNGYSAKLTNRMNSIENTFINGTFSNERVERGGGMLKDFLQQR